MPWSSKSEVPDNLKNLDGVALTLSQVNTIAEQADSIEGVDSPWAVAIANFKRSHKISNGSWIEKKEADDSQVLIQKEGERFRITTISTAALPDREEETYTVEAIDNDIEYAKETGNYPEFRVFHSPMLGIGRVEKMSRVGIFSVEEGFSYTDPFSLFVCKEWLSNNDGRWKVSRGFGVQTVDGKCPHCSAKLRINKEHMVAGFRCPGCGSTHLKFKGVLKDLHFRKTRVFDITITDVPAVPWTGAFAEIDVQKMEELSMNLKQLKERLLNAGVPEELVDARLQTITKEQLDLLGDDIPDAVLLKEFNLDGEDDDPTDEADVVTEVELKEMIRDAVVEVISNTEIELDPATLPTFKERDDVLAEMHVLKEAVAEIKQAISILLQDEETRLKEMLDDAPRAGRLRILRNVVHKEGKKDKKYPMEDDEEEEEEDMETVSKSFFDQAANMAKGAKIVGSDGKQYNSLSDFVRRS